MSQIHEDPNDLLTDLEEARQRFEQERMSRRAALRKLGISSAATVLGVFAADDLARMAIMVMEQNKVTQRIAEALAHDFKNAGVALAVTAYDRCMDQTNTAYTICCNTALANDITIPTIPNPILYGIDLVSCYAQKNTNAKLCETTYGPTSAVSQ